MPQPNILIIMADQLAPQFIGAHGCAFAHTPNIDALAARGMRFDAAYCNTPLCAPSRAAFMSGQLPSRSGVYDNAAEFPASVPSYAHYLRALGYQTCLAGRMHFVGPDQKHGFAQRLTTDIYPSDFAWTPDWEDNDTRIDSWYHNMDPVLDASPAHATFQTDYDDEVDFAANRWLVDRARQVRAGRSGPFCLVASFMHPHDPYVPKPEFWDLYEDVDIPAPDYADPAPKLDPFSRRIATGIGASEATPTPDQIAAARRGYLANVSYFDSKVGTLVQTLKDTGQLDNTIILITSDHGDMLGEKGLWYKMTMFEKSVRVPLIFAGPGVATGACDAPASLIDVLPTLIDIGGGVSGDMDVPVDGRSLWSMAQGAPADGGEAIVEYCAEMAGAPVVMIRRDTLKYIHCDLDPPQLYDLSVDPFELENLAGHADYSQAQAGFAQEIAHRWDMVQLRADVIRSQRARRVLHAMMETTGDDAWDYQPPRDARNEYVRNHIDWTEAAVVQRLPRGG